MGFTMPGNNEKADDSLTSSNPSHTSRLSDLTNKINLQFLNEVFKQLLCKWFGIAMSDL